jgi:predicted nucleotidyltransferase component of viral defense system
MIDYFQAQRIASKNGVPAEIIEKDFFIEFILFYLVRDSFFKEKLIFRGGTALKKIYFPDYRYSEDLDFLIQEREEIRKQEQRVNQIIEKINSEYPFQLNKRTEYSEDRLQLYLSYNIIPEIRAIKELKIDLLKDSIIPTFHRRKILWGYQEFIQETAKLNTYIFESIISDKICRILDVDNEPRDIYDLWYLLKLNLDELKIKKELKRRFGYDIHFPNLLSEITNEDFKRNWQLRLEKQVGNLPAYEIVIEELKKLIKEKLFPNNK